MQYGLIIKNDTSIFKTTNKLKPEAIADLLQERVL